jgi:hypothetical protein
MRGISRVARDYWDYTTLDREILDDAARLTEKDLLELARPGFSVRFFDTRESFFTAEALEYVWAWQRSTDSAPAGICGPIGPTEQLPLVARIVNDLEIDVRRGHFWAMDEWYVDGKEVPRTHPLSFARADLELCFNRIDRNLRMSDDHLHFLRADNLQEYTASYDRATCLIMQGGQGEVKHWAFNDPVRREGRYDRPERANLGRRRGVRRAPAGAHGRSRGDVEGAEGIDLASGVARQPLRHAADRADDLEAGARLGGSHVAARRAPRRAVQLPAFGHRHLRSGDALGVAVRPPRRKRYAYSLKTSSVGDRFGT